MHKYKTICISDVHLGTKSCKADVLSNFLKHHTADRMFLVGDIIDGWKIQQNKWRWKQSHNNAVRRILGHAKRGVQIDYVLGNHDEFLRPLLQHNINFAGIRVSNQTDYVDAKGKRWLIVHGDYFDGITRLAPWISFLGDKAYDTILYINTKFNWILRRLGLRYWSLSKFLKHKVKKAVDFIFQFEQNMASYCKKKGYDGVICGHIHHAEIKEVNGITYMNDGDWVESCTALVEDFEGNWSIVQWTKETDEEIQQ